MPEDDRHVLEALALDVLEHQVGDEARVRHASRCPGRSRDSRRCRCRRSSQPIGAIGPVEADLRGDVAEAVGARGCGRAGAGSIPRSVTPMALASTSRRAWPGSR